MLPLCLQESLSWKAKYRHESLEANDIKLGKWAEPWARPADFVARTAGRMENHVVAAHQHLSQ